VRSGIRVVCSLLYSWCLEQCLTHTKYLVNICQVVEYPCLVLMLGTSMFGFVIQYTELTALCVGFFCCGGGFETGSCIYVAQTGIEIVILLALPSECWD
jgi:hypothetical protein